MTERTTREVLEDHLRLRQQGDLATDLERNYAESVVLLCKSGVFRGRDAIRASAHDLRLQVPNAHYDYLTCEVEGAYGFLEWRAQAENRRAESGADSYVVLGGRIVMQTIHYALEDTRS